MPETDSPAEFLARLYDPSYSIPVWLFGALGLHDPASDRRLGPWYDFLQNESQALDGGIAEFGVYRGDSLLTAAILLKRLKSAKKVLGFDTFSGFPPLHRNDEPARFAELLKEGDISPAHYEAVKTLEAAEKHGLYRRHSFDATSLDVVRTRMLAFRLENVELHAGEFKATLGRLRSVTYSAVLLDCDLYESYKDVLSHCWQNLVPGGMIYLDEYYSLKYPGPRIALNEFCATSGVWPERILGHARPGEFERWCLRKPK